MDKGLLTGAVYLDLKKAFSTVNHEILLQKISALGIKDTELTWLAGNLDQRQQCLCQQYKFHFQINKLECPPGFYFMHSFTYNVCNRPPTEHP